MAQCAICNKPLTDSLSVDRGIGPDCWENLENEIAKNSSRFADRYCGKFNGDVVLMRGIDGAPLTNIPHRIILHSPTGYEWGYSGQGPADLALNILWQFTRADVALKWHQDFKHEFLTKMPKDGKTIKGEQIRRWIAGKTMTLF